MTTPSTTFLPPSGAQYEIGAGAHRAVVTQVGATLRSYTVDGMPVIDGFSVDERASAGRGQVLAPWPNRLHDGRYTFEGLECRAALDEPARSNAIHGLVRWLPWWAEAHSATAVTLACVLQPQPAYEWRLELRARYELAPGGLTVTIEATNLTERPAPFGVGFHPYLTVGTPTVDTAGLIVPARRRLLTDDAGIPTGDAVVAGTEFDYTAERPVGPGGLDTAYTDLVRGENGHAVARLSAPDGGRHVALWVDASYRYLMVFTGDTLTPVERRRTSIALEPMTCPPDALRSGTDLIRLGPGRSWRAVWGLGVGSDRAGH
jgi:aldose 1-epimerase